MSGPSSLALRVRFAELAASSGSASRRSGGRLHQPRPRRRRRRRDRRRDGARGARGARRARTSAACARFDAARSYGLAEQFLGELAARARPRPRRRLRQLQVGLRLHGAAGGRRRARTRSRSSRRAQLRRQWARDAGAARRRGCGSTRSTRRRWRAGCSTTPRCGRASTALRAAGVRIGLSATGPDRRRRSTARSRSAASTRSRRRGTCTSARPRARWRARARRRARGLRQGGAGERAAHRPRRAAAPLAAAARERDTTRDALALAAALAQPWADVVLSGAATVEQLESNLAARDVAWEGGLEELAEDPRRTGRRARAGLELGANVNRLGGAGRRGRQRREPRAPRRRPDVSPARDVNVGSAADRRRFDVDVAVRPLRRALDRPVRP